MTVHWYTKHNINPFVITCDSVIFVTIQCTPLNLRRWLHVSIFYHNINPFITCHYRNDLVCRHPIIIYQSTTFCALGCNRTFLEVEVDELCIPLINEWWRWTLWNVSGPCTWTLSSFRADKFTCRGD